MNVLLSECCYLTEFFFSECCYFSEYCYFNNHCFISVNESAEAIIRHNVYTHKNIARVTDDEIVELVSDDSKLVNQTGDNLMTQAAQELMVCLYRNQLLNVFVRVALVAIPINSCVQDVLSLGMYCISISVLFS